MLKLRSSHIFKFFMILCVVVQSAMLFPHHHHADAQAMCIGIFECSEPHNDLRDHQGCTHNCHSEGDHSMSRGETPQGHGDCSVGKLVVVAPQNEQSFGQEYSVELAGVIPSVVPVLAVDCCDGSCDCDHSHSGDLLPQSYIISYIVQAHSLRAPDLIS